MSKMSKEMEIAETFSTPVSVATQEESTPDHERPLLSAEKKTAAENLRISIIDAISNGKFSGWSKFTEHDGTKHGQMRYNVTHEARTTSGISGLSADYMHTKDTGLVIDRFSFYEMPSGGVVERIDVTIGRQTNKDRAPEYHIAYSRGHESHYDTNIAEKRAKKFLGVK